MENRPIAFVDECGSPGVDFSKPNVSTHFIVTAIVVDPQKLSEVDGQVQALRDDFFQGSPVKSQRVGKNDKRRLKVLAAIANCDFNALVLVVDKRRLRSEGFRYHRTFRFFLHERLYEILCRLYPHLRICADRCGDEAFQRDWKLYIERKHPPNLFGSLDFEFVASQSENIVQLADFVGGTLARHFDSAVSSPHSPDFIGTIRDKLQKIEEWPLDIDTFLAKIDTRWSEFDETIARAAGESVNAYLSSVAESERYEDLHRVDAVQHLWFNFRTNVNRYVPTHELISALSGFQMTERQFRQSVIGPLRDEGVLIVSNEHGYKVPCSAAECSEFVSYHNRTIFPMLRRISRFAVAINVATSGRVDLLSSPENAALKRALTVDHARPQRSSTKLPVSQSELRL